MRWQRRPASGAAPPAYLARPHNSPLSGAGAPHSADAVQLCTQRLPRDGAAAAGGWGGDGTVGGEDLVAADGGDRAAGGSPGPVDVAAVPALAWREAQRVVN